VYPRPKAASRHRPARRGDHAAGHMLYKLICGLSHHTSPMERCWGACGHHVSTRWRARKPGNSNGRMSGPTSRWAQPSMRSSSCWNPLMVLSPPGSDTGDRVRQPRQAQDCAASLKPSRCAMPDRCRTRTTSKVVDHAEGNLTARPGRQELF